jgi:hypothetical protein
MEAKNILSPKNLCIPFHLLYLTEMKRVITKTMIKISKASKPDTTSKFFSGGSMRDMNLSPYLKSKSRGC